MKTPDDIGELKDAIRLAVEKQNPEKILSRIIQISTAGTFSKNTNDFTGKSIQHSLSQKNIQ